MSARQEKDVYENWEEIDESCLENKLNSIINGDSKITEMTNVGPLKMILMGDDAYRTHPPEPTVKILKRPSKSPHSAIIQESKPRAPIKTLQQREQEYAEARLRILGSAKSPEEINEPSVNGSQSKSEITMSNDNSTRNSQWNNHNHIQFSATKSQECIVRQPTGPDGTNGFNMRR
ncbi:SUZ domain-containing protein 1-like [Ctenocephalides felis]|uniref:SUZ domain-containing protein 1-like n=1 Tax=Ctenocephalides felis TaxID=7515 RepID=UPI000E6E242E|nr:SUZ domain-containing protein 1-like [Ctenocephalides felis]XP_026462788.1 SUZ domain-containing protein 1-like [Ctenocephalides felis]